MSNQNSPSPKPHSQVKKKSAYKGTLGSSVRRIGSAGLFDSKVSTIDGTEVEKTSSPTQGIFPNKIDFSKLISENELYDLNLIPDVRMSDMSLVRCEEENLTNPSLLVINQLFSFNALIE